MNSHYENGVYYYQGLPDDLDKLKSYDAIKDIISPPLDDWQSVDLLRALFAKRYALFHSTGLGKTFIAAAYIKAIKNNNPNTKVLMLIKTAQQHETPKKIYKISGLTSIVYTAEQSKLPSMNDLDNCDILMLTHNALNSPEHMLKLLPIMRHINVLIVDEAHLLSNFEEAGSAFMMESLSKQVEYFLALTATPVTTHLEQFCHIMKIIGPEFVGNYRRLSNNLRKFGLDYLPSELYDMFSFRERDYSNRRAYAKWVNPLSDQVGARGKDLFLITKGYGATPQLEELVKIISERTPLQGIVYVNRTEVYKYLIEELPKYGIRFGVISGKINYKSDDRTRELEKFKNHEYDVMLTNAKEALDMDCSFCVFYEFTPHVKQFIGRGERGLNPKPMDILYIFTKDTDEYDYFIRNVYDISQEVQEIFGTDMREVLSLEISDSFKYL